MLITGAEECDHETQCHEILEEFHKRDNPQTVLEVSLLEQLGSELIEEDMGPEATCCICLMPYEIGDVIRRLPCDHAYHKDCIDSWLSTGKNTCPADQSTITLDAAAGAGAGAGGSESGAGGSESGAGAGAGAPEESKQASGSNEHDSDENGFYPGQHLHIRWQSMHGAWYRGRIVQRIDNGNYSIAFNDGDFENDVPAERMSVSATPYDPRPRRQPSAAADLTPVKRAAVVEVQQLLTAMGMQVPSERAIIAELSHPNVNWSALMATQWFVDQMGGGEW